MGPWGQEQGVGRRSMETLGAMAPGAMGPWQKGGASRVGGALGPFKVI